MKRTTAAVLAALALALPAPADAAAAQEIAGVAVDSAGHTLPNVPVALHRVGAAGGANVAAAATDDEGRFRFPVEAPDSAVHFVAMRHEGRLYIGPPARPGVEPVADYVLRAGPGSEAGAVASALSGQPGQAGGPAGGARPPIEAPTEPGFGAVWLVALLAMAVAAIFLTTAPGYRRRRRRDLLVELAGLENRLAAAGEADTAAERQRREALRERLAPPG